MEQRRLGRTEHRSSVAILGGAAFARSNPEDTAEAFAAALAAGVNHLDIAPRYGAAIELVGPILPPVRDQLFVACKTTRRSASGVRAQLEETLQVLGCDSFDLFQLHAVTSVEELGERRHAAEELLRARDEGLCRFAGITGHDLGAPAAHAEALRRYDFDTVMFPVFPRVFGNDDYRRDAEALLELCEERDAGVMAIKAAAARPWGGRPVEERETTTWYEAYRTRDEIARGVRFALSTDGVDAFCTPSDIGLLATALDVANSFSPMSEAERQDAIAEVTDERLIFPMAQQA